MLEAIMRINDAWNFRRATIGDGKRKMPASFLAEIGAEKCPQPGSPAFRDRKDDGVAVGELRRATAKIPSRTEHTYRVCDGRGVPSSLSPKRCKRREPGYIGVLP